jgi:hypothetical protein
MNRRTVAGTGAILFYAIHGGYWIVRGVPQNVLWACHLGSAAVGVGLLCRLPLLNGVGVLWLGMGNIFWAINLASGGELEPTSFLTHLGGLAVGLYGIKKLGLPRLAAPMALAALLALQRMTPWFGAPEENVNLAFRVWTGWERTFPSYLRYEVFLFAQAGVVFALLQWWLRKFLAAPSPGAA